MSAQLSLYWNSPDQLQWRWQDSNDIQQGALEDLLDQKLTRNIDSCDTRLFLPYQWFTNIDLQLPTKIRNISPTLLKFSAEEHLAQDIDQVHLVLKEKQSNGLCRVIATDLDRFKQIIQTLNTRQLNVNEAYNVQEFLLKQQTEDNAINITLINDNILLSYQKQCYQLHYRGFSSWFNLWLDNAKIEDAQIEFISDRSEGVARSLNTELETTGLNVHWSIQPIPTLNDWHIQVTQNNPNGNLIAGPFRKRQSTKKMHVWLPWAIMCTCLLVVWLLNTSVKAQQFKHLSEQYWQSSETVFKQVFGNNKRIQRPLMIREMRALANQNSSVSTANINALNLLQDLSQAAPESLILEDFRYQYNRSEGSFSLTKNNESSGDAYAEFEQLKVALTDRNYTVEYSANQSSDSVQARFRISKGDK